MKLFDILIHILFNTKYIQSKLNTKRFPWMFEDLVELSMRKLAVQAPNFRFLLIGFSTPCSRSIRDYNTLDLALWEFVFPRLNSSLGCYANSTAKNGAPLPWGAVRQETGPGSPSSNGAENGDGVFSSPSNAGICMRTAFTPRTNHISWNRSSVCTYLIRDVSCAWKYCLGSWYARQNKTVPSN